jgi:methyl-accepting chemotaxis protein
MTVAKKLAALAGAALAGIILISCMFIREIGSVYTSANFAFENTLPGLRSLDAMQSNFDSMRVLLWQHIVAGDDALMTNIEKQLGSHRRKIDEAFQAYEPTLVDAKDKELLLADREGMAIFDTLKDKGLALSRSGNKGEAAEMLMAAQPRFNKLLDQLNEHNEYSETLAKAASEAAVGGGGWGSGVGGPLGVVSPKEAAGGGVVRVRASSIRIGILLTVLTLGVVGVLAYLIARAIRRPLHQAVSVLAQIERGNYETPVTVSSRDETGQVLTALDTMQRSLKQRTEKDRSAAMENARIRTALDRVSVGAMLADMDGKIIYMNDFMTGIFRSRAAEIRKQLSQFDVERIIGGSFDMFHRVPAGLTSTHTADLKLGGATLRIIANPVLDGGGKQLGTVVQWIDRTQEIAIEEEIKVTVAQAIDGDLTARIREEGKEGFFGALAAGMNSLIDNMADVIRTMARAAAEMRTGADEISRGNLDLSQRTEEQASSLKQTAFSMEQMTAMVKNNAENAGQANQLASAAREQAERGGTVVGSAVAAMSDINSASKKIADIIGVIDEIAFQTNLLALNAAVEAARAGEQGRGFAVVASEVRNLASRSAAAAKEIKALIQDSVGKVTEGSKLVGESGKVLGEIVTGVKKVTNVMAEIAASSHEQATGIEQVNREVTLMDSVTQRNAALVEEASAAAQALTEQAANLTQLIARFHVGDESYALSQRPMSEAGTPTSAAAASAKRRATNRPRSGKPDQAAQPVRLSG